MTNAPSRIGLLPGARLREATELYLSEFPLLAPGHPVITMFTIPAHA